MLPEIHIGTVSLSTYWMMLVVGAVGMYFCILNRRNRFSLTKLQSLAFTILLTVVGVAGAKLLFILENLQETLENGISLGGVSFYGSVFLILILMPLIGWLFGCRGVRALDVSAPCVAIMIGCLRVGCFLSGCCGGWEMCIGDVCFRWPTQTLESIGDFIILNWLLQNEEKGTRQGKLYPLLMVSYSTMRFFIEFLRDTPKQWFYMSQGQWYALAAILIGVIWLKLPKRKETAV